MFLSFFLFLSFQRQIFKYNKYWRFTSSFLLLIVRLLQNNFGILKTFYSWSKCFFLSFSFFLFKGRFLNVINTEGSHLPFSYLLFIFFKIILKFWKHLFYSYQSISLSFSLYKDRFLNVINTELTSSFLLFIVCLLQNNFGILKTFYSWLKCFFLSLSFFLFKGRFLNVINTELTSSFLLLIVRLLQNNFGILKTFYFWSKCFFLSLSFFFFQRQIFKYNKYWRLTSSFLLFIVHFLQNNFEILETFIFIPGRNIFFSFQRRS